MEFCAGEHNALKADNGKLFWLIL